MAVRLPLALLAIAAALAHAGIVPVGWPKALLPQQACPISLFVGKWGFALSGTAPYPTGSGAHAKTVMATRKSVGYFHFAANGSATGVTQGAVLLPGASSVLYTRDTFQSTYIVTPECGILVTSSLTDGRTTHLFGLLNANKNELQFVQLDPGSDFGGKAYPMGSGCTTAGHKGRYTFQSSVVVPVTTRSGKKKKVSWESQSYHGEEYFTGTGHNYYIYSVTGQNPLYVNTTYVVNSDCTFQEAVGYFQTILLNGMGSQYIATDAANGLDFGTEIPGWA